MDFSQPVFGDTVPSQHDQRRVCHLSVVAFYVAETDQPLQHVKFVCNYALPDMLRARLPGSTVSAEFV